MPCYEYQCSKCGDTFEFLHLGGDDVVKCEKCGTKKVKRLLSSFGFGFKGFGTSPAAPADPIDSGGADEKTASGGGCSCSCSCSCG
ncbi:MAG: zinc ribbon domain-containing protein [Candidatus Mycalebacterium zealandia]|nr:MAG: zinc ribbon domain-containing protein [Candidatus Mycalebacterium zealandia]